MFRRGFLTAGVVLIGGAITAGVGALGGLFVKVTSRWPLKSAKKWAAVCKLSDLNDTEPFESSFSF